MTVQCEHCQQNAKEAADEVMSMLRRVRSLEAKVVEAHALLKEAWSERDALKVENEQLRKVAANVR